VYVCGGEDVLLTPNPQPNLCVQVWWLAGALHEARLPYQAAPCTAQADHTLPMHQPQSGARYMFALNLHNTERASPQLLMQLLKLTLLLPPEEVSRRLRLPPLIPDPHVCAALNAATAIPSRAEVPQQTQGQPAPPCCVLLPRRCTSACSSLAAGTPP
jgi:hypothetical protein